MCTLALYIRREDPVEVKLHWAKRKALPYNNVGHPCWCSFAHHRAKRTSDNGPRSTFHGPSSDEVGWLGGREDTPQPPGSGGASDIGHRNKRLTAHTSAPLGLPAGLSPVLHPGTLSPNHHIQPKSTQCFSTRMPPLRFILFSVTAQPAPRHNYSYQKCIPSELPHYRSL